MTNLRDLSSDNLDDYTLRKMIEINIDTNKLRAMRILAATNGIRYYLNGVCVEATASETRLLATDGSVAGFLRRCNPVDNVDVIYEEFILPNAVIDALPKNKGTQPIATVLVSDTTDQHGGGKTYTLRLWNGTLIPFLPESGVFPDLRRATPQMRGSDEGAQVDAELLMRFAKVNKALGASSETAGRVTLCHNGKQNALRVRLDSDDFVGVLMPWRVTENDTSKTDAIVPLPARGRDV